MPNEQPLTPIERALFLERGYLLISGLLSATHVDSLKQRTEALEQREQPKSRDILYTHAPPPPASPGLQVLMDQWFNPHLLEDWQGTASIARLLKPVAESLLGAGTVLFQDLLLTKTSRHKQFPWHQDFAFWPVDVPAGVVMWIALDPITPANGGLHLAEYSHLRGEGPTIDLYTGRAQEGNDLALCSLEGLPVIGPTFAAGDAVLFHPLTWHRSPPNVTGGIRRAWATSWLGPQVRWSHAHAPRHPLCARVTDGANVAPPA